MNAMPSFPKHITIRIPISQTHRQQAQRFAQFQPSREKAGRVYRNTLAVLATRNYLDIQNIPSHLKCSDSADVADLYIPSMKGRLECCAVQPGESACSISQDCLNERIGYMVVQLNSQYTEGRMLGFIKEASDAEVRLEDLGTLDDFIDCLPDAADDEDSLVHIP